MSGLMSPRLLGGSMMLQNPPSDRLGGYGCSLDLLDHPQLGGPSRINDGCRGNQIIPVNMLIWGYGVSLGIHHLHEPLQVIIQACSPLPKSEVVRLWCCKPPM